MKCAIKLTVDQPSRQRFPIHYWQVYQSAQVPAKIYSTTFESHNFQNQDQMTRQRCRR